MKIAFALLACAAAINIREESEMLSPEDMEYERGLAAGRAAAEGITGSEDFLWGYSDGVLEALIPDWQTGDEEWEDDDYHGEGW